MNTTFIIATRNLLQDKRRTLMLGSALGLVSCLLILLLSLSQGMRDTMLRSATLLVSGHVNVAGFYKAKPSDAMPMVTDFPQIKSLLAEKLDGVDYIVDRQRGWGKVIGAQETLQAAMAGLDINEEQAFVDQIQLAPKSAYIEGENEGVEGDVSRLRSGNSIMIFADQAKRMGVRVGDMVTLSTETFGGQVNTVDVEVVAVAKDLGMLSGWNIYLPKEVVRDLYQLNKTATGAIQIYLKDPRDAPKAMKQAREILAAEGYELMDHQPTPFWMKFGQVSGEDWTGQKIDLTLWEDEVSFLNWALAGIDALSIFLISILVMIIVVGIMNTMWIAVRERTQEIGTLRAIGMQRGQIQRLFLAEALVLGFLSTGLGTLLGAVIASVLDAIGIPISYEALESIMMSDTLHLSVSLAQVATATVVFTMFTMAAAWWPARRAARLPPVTAIQRL